MAKLHTTKFFKHKYHAKPTKVDNVRYDSKKEAKYAGQLRILQKCGEILFFLRQVPFEIGAGIKYRCDFMEFWANGDIRFVDIKGFMTPLARNKIKQVEDLYPIKIEVK